VTNASLAQSYLIKATKRLRILQVLLDDEAFSDVVREAQEIVELCLKGVLRQVGVEPPHWHDVSPMLMEYRERLPQPVRDDIGRIVEVSGWLRKEREFSFYGDIDFIPTEEYVQRDAERAIADARWITSMAALVIPPVERT
jgi:HEPN domain-containing protein